MFRNLAEDATIEIYFETFASTGAPVAPSSAFTTSDFAIYKNGSATAKATTNGLTVTSPFNSETGCHLLIIDTSNDTGDAGFWTTGARYQVKFNTAKTVDSKSIDGRSVPRGSFGIQSEYMRGTDSAALASGVNVTQFGGTNITAAAGIPEVKVASIANNAITANAIADNAIDTATFAAGATLPRVTLVDTCTTNTDMRGTDNAALAATALSTAVWTATIAGRIDVTLSTLATAASITTMRGADNDTLKSLSDQIDGIEGGGNTTVTVLPATGIVANRSAGVTLLPVVGETISQAITVYQSDGTTAVNLSGKTLQIIFETMAGTDVATVNNSNISVGGTGSNVVTFAYPSAVTASERTLRFALRDAAAPLTMYLQGVCSVVAAPKADT
jgi:hypothetical protein